MSHEEGKRLSKVEPVVAGAGILLYMARRCGGKRESMIVLAQEEFVNGWNQSGCWSAFEGGAKPGETTEETAAREFIEESAGSFAINGHRTLDEITGMLRAKHYAGKITVTSRDGRRAHVTYVVRIPWGTRVVEPFNAHRAHLARLSNACESIEKLHGQVRAHVSRDVMTGSLRQNPALAGLRARLSEQREAVKGIIETQPGEFRCHPAITPGAGGLAGAPVCVSTDYIEKRQIALVPLASLRTILRRADNGEMNARINKFRLRFCFVPVLRATINLLEGG